MNTLICLTLQPVKRQYLILIFTFLALCIGGGKSVFAQTSTELIQQAESTLTQDPSRALQLLEQALTLSIREGDKNAEADCYVVISKVNGHLRQYDLEVQNLERAKNILNPPANNRKFSYDYKSQEEDAVQESESAPSTYRSNSSSVSTSRYSAYNIQKMLAQALRRQGQIARSIQAMEEYARMATAKGDTAELLSTWNSLGDMYLSINQTSQAENYYQKVENLTDNVSVDNSVRAKIGLGNVEQRRGNYSEAESRFDDADAELMAQDDYANPDTVTLSRKGEIASGYNSIGEFDKEIQLRNSNVVVLENSFNAFNGVATYLVNEQLNIAESFLARNENDDAIVHFKKAETTARSEENLAMLTRTLRGLSKAYEAKGEVSNALSAYRELIAISDTLDQRNQVAFNGSNSDINLQLQRLASVESEMRLNDQAIQLLQQDRDLRDSQIRQQKLLILFMGSALAILLFSGYRINREAKKKRKANQLLALKSLRSQMNPHFIFNALNSINGFISRNQEKEANKYLSEFSKLMRSVLEDSQHDFLPLQGELENLKLYLKLEHARFEDKFDTQIEVEENIDLSSWQIPPMLIQPYVENAVWHGLRYKSEGKGLLTLSLKQHGDSIKITVTDDGVGRVKSKELKTKNQLKNKSTGLQNTQERLALLNSLYKTKYQVEIDDLHPEKEETGTRVTVTIPQQQVS